MSRFAMAVSIAALMSGSVALGLSPEQRTLTSAEMWEIAGGGTVADHCCIDQVACVRPDTACSDKDGQMNQCIQYAARTHYTGNTKTCTFPNPGTTCTYSSTTHTCELSQQCSYELATGLCKVASGGATSTLDVPDTCSSPGCP
jgi:hypothetical protein